jgi:light-regulated signal transduction histidine kinase (bacteriophytochrome)
MAIFAQLLAQRHNSEMGPQANQYIELVSGACGKMRRLVEDLLQYTRTVRTHGDLQPIDCENLVWENLKQAIDETGATITHDPLPSVLADPPRLRVCSQNRI